MTTKIAERVNIFENAVLMTLHFEGIGNRRQMDTTKVDTDADKDMLHLSKELLDSDEYRAIKNHRHVWRKHLKQLAVRGSGKMTGTTTVILPLGLLEHVEEFTRAKLAKDTELCEAFFAAYPRQVREAKEVLKGEFDPADYPPLPEVKKAFKVTTGYITMGTPESLKRVDAAVYNRERKKFYAMLEEESQAMRTALRQEMAELVAWMVEKLSDTEDGKQRVFGKQFESRLAHFTQFLDLFQHRNLTADTDLESLVVKAKAVLQGVNAEAVKGSDDFREQVRVKFAAVKETLGAMIQTKATRRIVLED